MNVREATEVIGRCRATWPTFAQDEIADRMWMEDLLPLDYEVSIGVWRWFRDTAQWPPAWSQFIARYKDRTRTYAVEQRLMRELEQEQRDALEVPHHQLEQ